MHIFVHLLINAVLNVINTGQNSNIKSFRSCNHAEIDALRAYFNIKHIKKEKKINFIVIRINKNGKLCESSPCVDCCLKLKSHININNIFYSTKDEKIIKIKFNKYCRDVSHVSKGNLFRNKK